MAIQLKSYQPNPSRMINLPVLLLLFVAILFSATSCKVNGGLSKTDHMGRKAEMSLRNNIVEYAKTWVGVPYRYAGQSPEGFDCAGFTRYVMQHFNLDLSSSGAAQANQGRMINLKDARPGDLIFYSSKGKKGAVTHVSLVVDNSPAAGITVVHATNSSGVIVQNVSKDAYWKPKILYARNVLSPSTTTANSKQKQKSFTPLLLIPVKSVSKTKKNVPTFFKKDTLIKWLADAQAFLDYWTHRAFSFMLHHP